MGREIVGGGIYADPDTKRLFIDLRNVSFVRGERHNLLAINRLVFGVALPSFPGTSRLGASLPSCHPPFVNSVLPSFFHGCLAAA